MDSVNENIVAPLQDFIKSSIRLVRKCTKPDSKEYTKVCLRTALGFVVMGLIGFFVKLIFIVSYLLSTLIINAKSLIIL